MATKTANALKAKLDATKLTATAATTDTTAAQTVTKATFAGMFAEARAAFNLSKDAVKTLKKAARLKAKIAKLEAETRALKAESDKLTDSLKSEIVSYEAAFAAKVSEFIGDIPESQAAYDKFCAGNVDKHGTEIPLIEQFAVDGVTVTYKRQTSMRFQQALFQAQEPEIYESYLAPQVARRMTIK